MDSAIKPQVKGTKQLFKNPILEKLSRTHISVPLIIFFSYAATLLYWSITHTSLSVLATVGMFIIGMIALEINKKHGTIGINSGNRHTKKQKNQLPNQVHHY